MAVRLRLMLKTGSSKASLTALANSGYEAEEPEILVPVSQARRLGLWPKLPDNVEVEHYSTAGGIVKMYKIPNYGKAMVEEKDRHSAEINCTLVISEHEEEVLLSDKLLDALKIALVKPGAGLWRFQDDPPTKLRKSKK